MMNLCHYGNGLYRNLQIPNWKLEFMVLYLTLKKFDFFFGCILGPTISNQTDNLSLAVQKPILSAVEAHDLVLKVLAVLRKDQSDECFKGFWKKLLP